MPKKQKLPDSFQLANGGIYKNYNNGKPAVPTYDP